MDFYFITWGSSLSHKNESWNLVLFFWLICLQIVLTIFLWIESSPLLKIWMENPTSAIFNTYNILSKAGFTIYIVLLWKFLTYVVNSRHRTYYSNICSSCYIWFHDVLWLRPKYPILMQVCFFLEIKIKTLVHIIVGQLRNSRYLST